MNNERDLITFGSFKDTKGSEIRVQTSSSIEPSVWIFTDNSDLKVSNPEPHLNKNQIKILIGLLEEALKHLEEE